MIMAKIKAKVISDKTNKAIADLLGLTKKEVLVGVPDDNTRYNQKPTKKDPEGGGKSDINNAALARIHDQGSPLQGIPARPFMIPGINAVQDKINRELFAAAKAQLSDDKNGVDAHLNSAGLIASSSIKNVINEGEGFSPLQRSTMLARLRKRKSAKKWSKEKREEIMDSMHPLIDTGQLRNSITYVIKDK